MSESKLLKTKRCTCCSNDAKNCYCHPSTIENLKSNRESVKCSNNCEEPNIKLPVNPSLSSAKSEIVKQWNKIKENERKQLEKAGTFLSNPRSFSEAFAKQRQSLLELERKNFRIWLMCKKNEEIEAKKRQEEMREKQEIERRKRRMEAQTSFQQWVQKKEELKEERRRKQQMRVMNELQMREVQLVKNQHAFNQWLEEAKNRPKPFNNNQSVKIFRSKSSVSYNSNRKPWYPFP